MSDCDKIVTKEQFWLLIISLKFLLNGQQVVLLFDPMCMFPASANGCQIASNVVSALSVTGVQNA